MAGLPHPYRVVRNTAAGKFLRELAQCCDFALAEAVYDRARGVFPGDVITIQTGSRIMRRSDSPGRLGDA